MTRYWLERMIGRDFECLKMLNPVQWCSQLVMITCEYVVGVWQRGRGRGTGGNWISIHQPSQLCLWFVWGRVNSGSHSRPVGEPACGLPTHGDPWSVTRHDQQLIDCDTSHRGTPRMRGAQPCNVSSHHAPCEVVSAQGTGGDNLTTCAPVCPRPTGWVNSRILTWWVWPLLPGGWSLQQQRTLLN